MFRLNCLGLLPIMLKKFAWACFFISFCGIQGLFLPPPPMLFSLTPFSSGFPNIFPRCSFLYFLSLLNLGLICSLFIHFPFPLYHAPLVSHDLPIDAKVALPRSWFARSEVGLGCREIQGPLHKVLTRAFHDTVFAFWPT